MRFLTRAKFWIFERDFERDKEDEEKARRRTWKVRRGLFSKADAVAAEKPKLQPEGISNTL
ncbi:MAG TPA: hypothetical protein DF383_05625 [Deltaproteobacteria bacterium]|nr:hypothetical protein [Deltaproteobacteria bacterium]